ncbi:MAG: diphthine--ammonia ligase [Nanoarchaeota archaeon]
MKNIKQKKTMKLAALFTGGKDSTYAIYLAKQQGHEIACLITMKSENPHSYMFHTPAIELTKLQAEAMELPIFFGKTKGEKEKELLDLEKTIRKAKEKYDFMGLVTGALFSEYQKSRIEKIAQELRLKVLSPLWQKSQEEEIKELLDNNFEVIITAIAGEGLNESWLGKKLDQQMLNKLTDINKRVGINIAFEGGEAESLVVDCPLFKKKIKIIKFQKVMDSANSGRIIVKNAELMNKK